MDFPVEATVHLNVFRDQSEVREILTLHDFVMADLYRDQLRVKGSFLKLKAVKTHLEQLLNSQAQTKAPLYSSSPVPVSSGAISKLYPSSSSMFREKPLHASPSSPNASPSWVSDTSYDDPTFPDHKASFSPGADQRPSFRHGSESFIIDADVFNYASRVRKSDIDIILQNHDVKLEVFGFGDTSNITLQGKGAGIAASKLQSLLNDLNKSLRTQEVPWKDISQEGKALLKRIQKNNNIYNLVLVCEMNNGLDLIGPRSESYELKQALLGRPVNQSGRTGRTFDKNSRESSTFLPPNKQKDTNKDSGAIANPSPIGASGYSPSKGTGYSPSKHQDDKQEGAKPKWGAGARHDPSGALRTRSHSESREKNQAQTANSIMQETENGGNPSKALKKPLLSINTNIKQKFKKKMGK